MSEVEEEGLGFDMFAAQEPTDYYRPKREASVELVTVEDKTFTIGIIGEHSLWGNYLWNAARCLTKYFFRNPEIVQGKTVLEIGAGGGLPSLVAAHLGAKRTILTDYPDNSLIDNLKHNVETNRAMYPNADITVQPLLWGTTTDLNEKFDLIILSDLLNNHSAHEAMLETCEIHAHKKDTLMLVSFTHHQPWKAHKNMKFFDIAKRKGFSYEKMFEEKYPVMFEKDPGDEEVRRTVHVYSMRLN